MLELVRATINSLRSLADNLEKLLEEYMKNGNQGKEDNQVK